MFKCVICEFSADCRRLRGSSPPLNNQRAITPPGTGRPRHPWLESPVARRQHRQSNHSWVNTSGGQQTRRRHTVASGKARRRSGLDGRSSFGAPGRRRGGGRYHNDLTGSGGSPDDWRSSPSNTDEHKDKMVT